LSKLQLLQKLGLILLTEKQSPSQNHLSKARASIQQALSWYSSFRRHWNYPPNAELQAEVRDDLQNLKAALEKLDQQVIKIAAFGLVSKGKSAVINALLGQKILTTGPIHGVTKWPKSIRWTPPSGKVQIEFIDTPGLDEIDGETRANMAKEVVSQCDLILFVIAGDINRTEYNALLELRNSHKPLILVFNKIDLYPEVDRQSIYKQLQTLSSQTKQPLFTPDDIVMVAAEPQPLPVRIEWEDGRITQEWENSPPQIDPLREKILDILNREGRSLLALNSLTQAKKAQINIAQKTIKLREEEAEEIIWKYTKYKALIIAINPIAFFDILGGTLADLTMIRALARLYGLPITSYEAGKLWQNIVKSLGYLFLAEIGTLIFLGLAKTGNALSGIFENPANFTTYATTALTQGSIAGYGSYLIGKAAKEYLEKGCTWGNLGADSVIQEILHQVEPNTIIYRLNRELNQG
jgi:small GTP-binding protein